MAYLRSIFAAISLPSLAFVLGAGCGTKAPAGFSEYPGPPVRVGSADAGDGTGYADGGGATGLDFGDAAPGGRRGCVNLQCRQVECGGSKTTTLSGVVRDPGGHRPLYNAIVYVPNEPLKPLPEGVSCDKCGVLTTGAPIATALSGADGSFVLKNVPSGTDIPLVIQIGKWRRQVTIPTVTACKDNPISNTELTRLPRNKSEGDIPKIAIATGGADPFECLLRTIGVDDAEVTNETGQGRIHLFRGAGGSAINDKTPDATTLWSDGDKLKSYDIVINACEGSEHPETKPESSIRNIYNYANAGGRVFASHFQYYWIDPTIQTPGSPAPWKNTANFTTESSGPSDATAYIDMSFPKGKAFGDWLHNVGASTTLGQVDVHDLRYNVTTENAPSRRWVYGTNPERGGGTPALFFYTFNTPTESPTPNQCGKVLFSDFHVAGSVGGGSYPEFPGECSSATSLNQQEALEFMLFDLSSCIQPEADPPAPPSPR